MDQTPTFTELAPVKIIEETTCNSEDTQNHDGMVKNGKHVHSEFHELLTDLEYQSTPSTSSKPVSLERQLELSDDEDEDDDFVEDLEIKYPYERPINEGLMERINETLELGIPESVKQADAKLEEIEELLKRQRLLEKLQKRESRLIGLDLAKESFLVCLFCSKSFNTSEELQNHVKKMHDFSKNVFKCKTCGAGYRRKKNLELHMKKHTSSEEYGCKQCSYVFKNQLSLRAHEMRDHSSLLEDLKEKEEMCRYCRKNVPEATIKRHEYYCKNKEKISKQRAEKKSTSVPPSPALSVASSSASFLSLGSTNVSPSHVSFVDKRCKVCGEEFASRQSMLRHVGRKHPEAKDDESVTAKRFVSLESPSHQYACQECGKRFTTKAALTLHKERIHEKNMKFECEICHRSYPIASELRKHVNRVHNSLKSEELVEMEF